MARPLLYKSDDVLRVAARVFLEDGLNASTVRIARLAGTSEATLFKRFKTKEALFEAAMDLELAAGGWGDALIADAGKREPAANLTEALFGLLSRLGRVMPRMMLLRGAARHRKPGALGKDAPPLRDARIIAQYLREEHRLGRLSVNEPEMHAHQMVGSIAHYVLLGETSGVVPGKAGAFITHLVRTHLAAMAPKPKAAKRMASRPAGARGGGQKKNP